ncbi:hypothetical protein [Brucella sp. NBRC 12950]|uniref:hypothetical protein n=1 Tax=Brucella sp. NBRC 12950 TaxID=2994518 RepID=UPI0024A3FE90|nr:hypothetical protein [Brucella sp. NBRC 12950]GLU29460.1 hypothetical protein Brsp01_46930 [Brucella sp. NBRC 12950]
MAVLSDYTSGTITLANGSTAVTGTGTLFDVAKFREGDTLQIQNLTAVIASVNSNTSLTLTSPWTGTSLTNAPYRARYLPDGARVTAQATTLIELLGNGVLSSLAEIGVEEGKAPVGNATGGYELKPFPTDPNGSLGKLAALTLAARQILQTDGTGALTALTLAAQQILQTDANGALKAIALLANKALVTDANKDVQQIDLGALGRTLLALSAGTNAQYIQGDGTVQAKTGLPISTATQTALNAKANNSGAAFTTGISINSGNPGTGQTLINFGWSGRQPSYKMFLGSGEQFIMDLYDGITGNYVRGAFQVDRSGNTAFYGSISKAGGTFLIDHPLDPFNKNLRHGFVESTEYVNIYRGMVDLVDGRMTVDIDAAFGMTDGTFAALNADVMVSSLQNQYGPDRVWVEAPADSGKFTIICEDPESTATIAWMVTGRRNDAFVRSDLDPNTDSEGRFIPEFEKPEFEENEDG